MYGFFLLTVLLYVFVRRPEEDDPRRAAVSALEELQDAIYGELDERDVERLLENLDTAQKSERQEISHLATVLHDYVRQGNVPFKDYDPNLLHRLALTAGSWGRRLGRRRHRILILAGLVITAASAIVTVAALIWVAVSPTVTTETLLAELVADAAHYDVNDLGAQYVRVILEICVGAIALVALRYILQGKERRGLALALIAILLALTALQLLTFYLEQFSAVIPALFLFGFLLLTLQYRRWYVAPDPAAGQSD